MDKTALKSKLLLSFFCLASFYIIISTSPPAVYTGDSGETIAVSYTLGIQHPPGYPLITMLGKIFTFIPLGDVSFRLYLMSAFLSTACFIAIYLFFCALITIIKPRVTPPLFEFYPSLIFIAGFSIRQQAATAKGGIYLFNILFLILISLVLVRLYKSGGKDIRYLYLFFLLFGISLSNHHMSQVVMFPAYAFIIIKSGALSALTLRRTAFSLFLLLTGVFIYYYLPVRAHTAVLNWGEPSTFTNFMEMITRYQYIKSEGARSLSGALTQTAKFFTAVSHSMLYAGFLFALLGYVFLFRKNKAFFIYTLSVPVIFMLVTTIYLNLTKDKLYIMETYITPSYFALSIAAAYGAAYAAGLAGRRAAASLFALIIGLQFVLFYPPLDKSRYFFTYDYNRNILSSLEPGSVIFLTGDGVVFPSWYFKYVKKYREDVTIAGSAVIPMDWVRNNIKKQNPALRMPVIKQRVGNESTGYIINAILRMNSGAFPFYFSYNKPEENALDATVKIMPKGIVQKVLPSEQAVVTEKFLAANRVMWQFYSLRGSFYPFKKYIRDKNDRLYLNDYSVSLNSTGIVLEDEGYFALSRHWFEMAHKLNPHDHEYIFNIGNSYHYSGDNTNAVLYYKKSIAADPKYVNAWFNLGVTYFKTEKYKEALEAFKKVREINPSRTDMAAYIRMCEEKL